LPWNICPFCGTPAVGMRRDAISMDDALKNLQVGEDAGEVKIEE
jgi:hypothetical protein